MTEKQKSKKKQKLYLDKVQRSIVHDFNPVLKISNHKPEDQSIQHGRAGDNISAIVAGSDY